MTRNNKLFELDGAHMDVAQRVEAGVKTVKGLGGIDIPVNKSGYLIDPAGKLPPGMLDKFKNAWAASNGSTDTFFAQTIDGKKVSDILAQCPNDQSYGIAKALNLPGGTDMPCQTWREGWTAIKWGEAGGATPPPVPPTEPVPPTTGGGTLWWKWFLDPKVLVIAALATAGIIAAIKALGNTIKARFRKTAKVLYTMQKDFSGAENGMDMDHALPGVGSKITDFFVKMFGRGKKTKGALGLRPFVDGYTTEIAMDYQEARKAFNMIATAGKGLDTKRSQEQTSGASNNFEETHNESVGIRYTSFREAISAGRLNEAEGNNDPSTIANNDGNVALSSVKLKNGEYLYSQKDENGNDGESKVVQVNQESTREICFSIMNMFFSKYFDMSALAKKAGVDSLRDLDKSNADKFAQVVEKLSKIEFGEGDSKASKMFNRVKKNYDKMIDGYCRIANGIVANFVKHTKKAMYDKDSGAGTKGTEKNENLLVSVGEKLKAEVRRQEDLFTNNFFRVANAIVTSPEYTTYVDFIVKDVMPVFKSGLASDADYVLDIVPKEGDYFVVHQTNDQNQANGNTALVKITAYEGEGSQAQIGFEFVGLIKNPDTLNLKNNEYDFTGFDKNNIDTDAYKGRQIKPLPVSKWLALDPIKVNNFSKEGEQEEQQTAEPEVYTRDKKEEDGAITKEYLFVFPTAENSETPAAEQTPAQAEQQAETPDKNASSGATINYNEDVALSEDEKDETSENKPAEQSAENQQANEQPTNEAPAESAVKQMIFVKGDINKPTDVKDIELAAPVKTEELDKFVQSNPETNDPKTEMGFKKLDGQEAETLINAVDDVKQKIKSKNSAENTEAIPPIINAEEAKQEEPVTAEAVAATIKEIATSLANSLNKDENRLLAGINKNQKVWQVANIDNPNIAVKPCDNPKVGFEIVCKYIQLNDSPVTFIIGNAGFDASTTDNSETAQSNTQTPDNQEKERDIYGQYLPNQMYMCAAVVVNGKRISGAADKMHQRRLDRQSLLNGFNDFSNDMLTAYNRLKAALQKANITPVVKLVQNSNQSFKTAYSNMFNLAESFMGTLAYLKVNRSISKPRTKDIYYVLSENAWGDGSVYNPEKYLTEKTDNYINKCKNYDDFAKLAKSSVSINFMPITEDCSYKTSLPYNRYQMLTQSNPLYESTVIVSFDADNNVKTVINKGITKIAK